MMFASQALFLNILFKSLKSDPEIKRVKAFLKRILQVCCYHSPPFACGCLYMISEVSHAASHATYIHIHIACWSGYAYIHMCVCSL